MAAEAELMDGENGAIYWWGVGGNMVRCGNPDRGDSREGGYTLGELRTVIVKAQVLL